MRKLKEIYQVVGKRIMDWSRSLTVESVNAFKQLCWTKTPWECPAIIPLRKGDGFCNHEINVLWSKMSKSTQILKQETLCRCWLKLIRGCQEEAISPKATLKRQIKDKQSKDRDKDLKFWWRAKT